MKQGYYVMAFLFDISLVNKAPAPSHRFLHNTIFQRLHPAHILKTVSLGWQLHLTSGQGTTLEPVLKTMPPMGIKVLQAAKGTFQIPTTWKATFLILFGHSSLHQFVSRTLVMAEKGLNIKHGDLLIIRRDTTSQRTLTILLVHCTPH